MKIVGLVLAAVVATALGSAASAQQRPISAPAQQRPISAPAQQRPMAAPGCMAITPGNGAFMLAGVRLVAEHLEEDPLQVWSKYEMWNVNSPEKTAIWQGVVPVCGGQVIVSQIVNRQCSSASVCPARVVFRDGQQERVLLGYKQICTTHSTIDLRGDMSELRACGQTFALRPIRDN